MKELLEKLIAGESSVDDVLTAINEGEGDKVPRSRLNAKIQEVKDLEGELTKRNQQLEELGGKAEGNEKLTEEINKLKVANEQQAKEYESKLQQQTFDAKLSDALREAKVRNPRAVKALLEADKIKLDGDKLLGLDDQLGALKESDAYLFVQEEDKNLRGRQPHIPNNEKHATMTKDKLKNLSYKELVDFKQTQPEQYEALSKLE